MAEGAHEKCDEHGHRVGQVGPGREVDVTAEEVVNGDIPLAGELEPVGRVPPVGVEVAVGEARDLGEGAEEVFEDDEEDEEEDDHEGEEEEAGRLGQEKAFVGEGSCLLETHG